MLAEAGVQQGELLVGEEDHLGGFIAAQPIAIARIGLEVPGSHRAVEGTR